MLRVFISALLIVVAFGIVFKIFDMRRIAAPGNRNQAPATENVYAYSTTLRRLWDDYKARFIVENRTIDPEKNNITTSEGQAYSMLRAVWVDDKPAFDSLWAWTKTNLQHESDALFSWLYGELSPGRYGILTDQGGQVSASDADSDIALALIFAGQRWNNEAYTEEAKRILNDIWQREVVHIRGRPYLVANDRELTLNKQDVLINPSYCSPYAYRVFASLDSTRPWTGLVDTCYEIISTQRVGELPPDWLTLNKQTAALGPPPAGLSPNYGYDAFRLPFKLALDHVWSGDERAREALGFFKILSEDWEQDRRLYAVYDLEGNPAAPEENMALYGGNIGYFIVFDKPTATEVMMQKILAHYNPDSGTWGRQVGYYEANLAWFAIALYADQLHNLALN